MHYIKLAMAGMALLTMSGCEMGFADEDIASLHQDIRAEYTAEGATVFDVQLVKESPKKLTGFIKFSVEGMTLTHGCEATYGDDHQIVWRCAP